METTLSTLVKRLDDPALSETRVIPWGSPVLSFGDLSCAKVATLGLNPSNREFVDDSGNELDGASRRFHTLSSLSLRRWSDATARHLRLIMDYCRAYFLRNPYDAWFRKLDHIVSGTKASYYGTSARACHLDLIPYATACKWTELSNHQRLTLLDLAGDTLGLLVRESPVRLLVLNGSSVVQQFQAMSGVLLEKQPMYEWSLPRRSSAGVMGFSYMGTAQMLWGIKLKREILVLGFNHNIQSSFGVTTQVMAAIRNWIAMTVRKSIL